MRRDHAVTFSDLYEQHVGDVYGYLAYRSRSRRAAEALSQETFERAMRGWRLREGSRQHPKVWLLTVARCVYIDSRRGRRAGSSSDASNLFEGRTRERGRGTSGPPGVAAALARLERREREALALRFGGDMRNAEIAELLGISVSNAQQILARALRRLRSIDDHAGT